MGQRKKNALCEGKKRSRVGKKKWRRNSPGCRSGAAIGWGAAIAAQIGREGLDHFEMEVVEVTRRNGGDWASIASPRLRPWRCVW